MLDVRMIRENPNFVKSNLAKRGDPAVLKMFEELINFDCLWRQKLTELNDLRHERKLATAEVASLKKKGAETADAIKRGKALDALITETERQVADLQKEVHYLSMHLPNLLHHTVPQGKGEEDNVTVRTWEKPRKFHFEPKDHIELGLGLDIMDVERAGKVAGSRFFYLKNEGVILDLALECFALEQMVKKGYIAVEPPFLMRREAYEGVLALSDFENMLYKIDKEDLYLIATSEHPMAAMYMKETLISERLPLRMVGVSPNFRKEAGTHGKDTRGIFRTHQFNKVEQFIFCRPEDSWSLHEELIGNAEFIAKELELPYRVVNICTGDLGSVAAKRYDIEAWMPAQRTYRELGSCSNCTDYQARRLNIKYRQKEGEPPAGFVHTLNSTALATGRTMVAILENFQQEDGSVMIPDVLRKYMYGIKIIEPKR